MEDMPVDDLDDSDDPDDYPEDWYPGWRKVWLPPSGPCALGPIPRCELDRHAGAPASHDAPFGPADHTVGGRDGEDVALVEPMQLECAGEGLTHALGRGEGEADGSLGQRVANVVAALARGTCTPGRIKYHELCAACGLGEDRM